MSVYINSSTTRSIPAEDLVVGDIYRVTAGMVVPADSVLLHCGHPLNAEVRDAWLSEQ